jgi:epoxyqueuosine reductase
MSSHDLKMLFESKFDLVGIISTKRYATTASKMGFKVPNILFPAMVVLGLSYPKRVLRHTQTHLIPSFYTFGQDYHHVLQSRIQEVMKKTSYRYESFVDNHSHNERLAATLAGLGYFAKNQLIINEDYGSYFFIGLVTVDMDMDDEIIHQADISCEDCKMCIDACPTEALSEEGFIKENCMSFYNQSKKILTDRKMTANYCLFGCDICQLVCPKNIGKGKWVHPEFELTGKEAVSILDLFMLSDKSFREKYANMAYLWKGKTVLMRNALLIMSRQKNTAHLDLIRYSLNTHITPWYHDTATVILSKLTKINR